MSGVAMDLKKHIGLRVKSARQQKGWTQEQFASRLHKAVETISHIERGATFTGLQTLEQMAKLLDKPMAYFFEGAERARTLRTSHAVAQQTAKVLIDELSEKQVRPVISLLEATIEQSRSKSSASK
jgi:transcriptional regulator with XRE-family HTH domain